MSFWTCSVEQVVCAGADYWNFSDGKLFQLTGTIAALSQVKLLSPPNAAHSIPKAEHNSDIPLTNSRGEFQRVKARHNYRETGRCL